MLKVWILFEIAKPLTRTTCAEIRHVAKQDIEGGEVAWGDKLLEREPN